MSRSSAPKAAGLNAQESTAKPARKARLGLAASGARKGLAGGSCANDFFPSSAKPALAASWTEAPFESDVWVATNPNPGMGGCEAVSFANLPETFRRTVKELLRALDQHPSRGARRAKSAGTAKTVIAICNHFANHIHKAGATRFSQATQAIVERAHLDYCGLLGGEKITSSRAARYLSVLGKLHELGPAGLGLLADGLMFDPSKAALHVGRGKALAPTGSTPELSEESGRKLMLMALDWVENKTEAVLWILKAYEALSDAKAKTKHAGKSGAYALQAIRAHVAAFPSFLAELEEVRQTMGGPLVSLIQGSRPKPPKDASSLEIDCLAMGLVAQNVQLTFQGFCYVVCAGFNGWRANEIFSIDASSLKETPAGYALATKVRKTSLNPNATTDRPVPPIVAHAVKSLAKVNERPVWFAKTKADESADEESGMGRDTSSSETPSGSIFRSSAGALIDTHAMSERITAAWGHFTGSQERITTHQFRRFFALFYLRRHQGNLDAIRRHFRHVSRDMVWAYVKDGLNAQYLAQEKKKLAQEIASSVVFDQGYSSIGVGKDLKKVAATLRFQGKTLSVEDAAAYIEAQIKTAFMDVHAMEWGYCLFQKGDSGAACEAKDGPIESRAEPGTCGRCKFLCSGQEHGQFWMHAKRLHAEIISHPLKTHQMQSKSEHFIKLINKYK